MTRTKVFFQKPSKKAIEFEGHITVEHAVHMIDEFIEMAMRLGWVWSDEQLDPIAMVQDISEMMDAQEFNRVFKDEWSRGYLMGTWITGQAADLMGEEGE